MVGFLKYAVLRSLYVLLALAAIWGSLLWGPWLSLPLAIVALHLVTYIERWTGQSPPDLVTAPAWFGRWLSNPEDAHGLLFCGLHIEHHEQPAVHWSELPRLHAAMKPELIAGGAHIVPYGIYRASSLLNSFFRPRQGWQRFLEQHPEYLPAERPR